jgi:hypothetical protein
VAYERTGLGAVAGQVARVEGNKLLDLVERLRSSTDATDAAGGEILRDMVGSSPVVARFTAEPDYGITRVVHRRGGVSEGRTSPTPADPATTLSRLFWQISRLPQLTEGEYASRVAAATAPERQPTPARLPGDGLLPSSIGRRRQSGGGSKVLPFVLIGGGVLVAGGILWFALRKKRAPAAVTANRRRRRR